MGKPVKLTDKNKVWARRPLRERRIDERPQRERILIVCEGGKTEPNYFKSIKDDLSPNVAEIRIHGEGKNTQSLVDQAKKHRDAKSTTDYPYDEVWVVFDRDSFKPDQFDNAIHSAVAGGMRVAWSNEAFELWYILHFEDRQTGMSRDEYKACLTGHLDSTYQKNHPDMYAKLAEKGDEAQAIKRAVSLQEANVDVPRHAANPCTTVNELVAKLNTFKKPTR